MSGVQLIFEISTRNSQEATRLNEDFVVYRMTNANDALYIAIDFISQSILVDVLDIQFFSRLIFLNDVESCGANHWLSHAFYHLRFEVLI